MGAVGLGVPGTAIWVVKFLAALPDPIPAEFDATTCQRYVVLGSKLSVGVHEVVVIPATGVTLFISGLAGSYGFPVVPVILYTW